MTKWLKDLLLISHQTKFSANLTQKILLQTFASQDMRLWFLGHRVLDPLEIEWISILDRRWYDLSDRVRMVFTNIFGESIDHRRSGFNHQKNFVVLKVNQSSNKNFYQDKCRYLVHFAFPLVNRSNARNNIYTSCQFVAYNSMSQFLRHLFIWCRNVASRSCSRLQNEKTLSWTFS